jgi:hypothetical protein
MVFIKNFLFFFIVFFLFDFLGREIDGSIVEVTLAKPVDKNQYFRFTRGVSPSTIAANLPVKFSLLSSFCFDRNFILVWFTTRYRWSSNNSLRFNASFNCYSISHHSNCIISYKSYTNTDNVGTSNQWNNGC